jgi:hydrophobic/amphiphilic exporter-1 (mainly G- bacteria), HAE1 family
VISTLLSLVFVPAFFTIMDDVGHLCWRVFGRFVTASDEEIKHEPPHAPPPLPPAHPQPAA